MEYVLALFVLVGGSIAFSAWKNSRSADSPPSVDRSDERGKGSSLRRCLACGHEGEMKTWIANYTAPKCFFMFGFLLGYIPGLIFIAVYWGKYKCPVCGAVGKNRQIVTGGADTGPEQGPE